jgi:hypothetical protein
MNATLAFVFLAEECVAVFLGPVGKVNYKGFHLLAGSLTEGLSAAEKQGTLRFLRSAKPLGHARDLLFVFCNAIKPFYSGP